MTENYDGHEIIREQLQHAMKARKGEKERKKEVSDDDRRELGLLHMNG